MFYINMRNSDDIETVDEFETLKESKKMLAEYRIADRANEYYISNRSTKIWREESKKQWV